MTLPQLSSYFIKNGWNVTKQVAADVYNYQIQCFQPILKYNLLFVYYGNQLCSYAVNNIDGEYILRSDHRYFKDLELEFMAKGIPVTHPIALNNLVEKDFMGQSGPRDPFVTTPSYKLPIT